MIILILNLTLNLTPPKPPSSLLFRAVTYCSTMFGCMPMYKLRTYGVQAQSAQTPFNGTTNPSRSDIHVERNSARDTTRREWKTS